MKICFIDFWPEFNSSLNIFHYSLKEIKENIFVVNNPDEADIIFYSVFDNMKTKKTLLTKYEGKGGKKWVFFTGENKRPEPFADINLTFDYKKEFNNYRFPLWWMYIDWFNTGTWQDPEFLIPVDKLLNPYENTKKEFACMIAGNEVPIRKIMVDTYSKYGRVDCHGRYLNNVGGVLGGHEKEKIEVLRNYRYCICPENSLYPGYCTEKLLHALIAGCTPIYWGDQHANKDFGDCFINWPDEELIIKEFQPIKTRKEDILNIIQKII